MSLYNDALYKIKHNKDVRETGGVISIPWFRLPRLSKVIPGLKREEYVIITSGTKESKTQLCDFLYVIQPIEWLLANQDKDVDLKLKYFSLEISKELKAMQFISYKLLQDYNIVINPSNLLSTFNSYILDSKVLKIIQSPEMRAWFEFFEDKVEIIDNIKHPTGIMVNVEAEAKNSGKLIYEETTWDDGTKHQIIKGYNPHNPKIIVNTIVDHATLLSENGKSLYECIKTLSSNHILKLKNVYGQSFTLIQQQNAESSSQQFTNSGKNILDKVRPTREGLAGCKDTAQDCTLMMSIFSPYKYKVPSYENWDLTKLRDYHREISILLNRSGKSNASIQMYFNGASCFFKELPLEPSDNVYKFVQENKEKEELYN